ncbi:MAG TPA: carbamoyl phosphate synthase large subunit, partial [Chromatiaceae bacterium]|nr:carbamoyl phosphate synthase large subunit [Chromatiaceae bacterium]
AVKSVVFPFLKLAGTDTALGPEMRSTGETMGIGSSFDSAYFRALLAAGISVNPAQKSLAFLSLRDEDKKHAPELAGMLRGLGFSICGTRGTVEGIPGAKIIPKVRRGNPDVLEAMRSKDMGIVVNTPSRGGSSHTDGFKIRRLAIEGGIPCFTNVSTALQYLKALKLMREEPLGVAPLSDWNCGSFKNG